MTFYEFFAGGGMARAGLGYGWACSFANEDNHGGHLKIPTYIANFGRADLVTGDVAKLTTADLPGRANLAWASPPCQDVSLAGDREGLAGDRSGAFWPFWKLMRGLRTEGRGPKIIVIENVTGLLTSDGGKDFDAICAALTEDNYRFGALVIDASLFVPQSRERVFIVATDAALSISADLLADGPTGPFHPSKLVAACLRQRNPIWWRLPVPPKRNTVFADVIEDTPTGVAWHTGAETAQIVNMMAPAHLAKLKTAKRAGRRMVGGVYKRMRPAPGAADVAGQRIQRVEVRFDDIAGCLRMPTGGSSRQTVMVVDGDLVRSRLLSPREAARLMGLGDDYKLPSNYNEAYGVVGDGVAVPVVRHLAEHILEPLLRAQAASSAKPIAAQ